MVFEYLEIAGTILFPKNKQVKCSLISFNYNNKYQQNS